MSIQLAQKQQLADSMVDSFRNELSWTESMMLIPVMDQLDDILMSEETVEDIDELKQLGLWKFLYQLMDHLGVGVVDKLVKFLVTKQIELQKARTRLDILKLKQSITGALTPSEQTELDELQSNDISIASTKGADDDTPLHIDTKNDEDNSQKSSTLLSAQENEDNANTIMPAAITSAAVAGVGVGGYRTAEHLSGGAYEKLGQRLSPTKLKSSIDDVIYTLSTRLHDPKLTTRQKKSLQHTIDKLTETKKSTESLDDLHTRKRLASKQILPAKVFDSLQLSSREISTMMSFSDDTKLLKKLSQYNDPGTIAKLLTKYGITNPSDELIGSFVRASTPADAKALTRVLGQSKHIRKLAKFAKVIPLIDAAAMGLDVWMYLETDKEAELIARTNEIRASNKHAQAKFQLAMGIVDGAVGIGAGIAVGLGAAGPAGWVALGVAGAGVAVSHVVESTVFDVADQYTQNELDYLSQSRTQLQHAILQATARGDSQIDLSWSEKTGEGIRSYRNSGLRGGPIGALYMNTLGKAHHLDDVDLYVPKTLEDAYRALIVLEEVKNNPSDYRRHLEHTQNIEKLDEQELQSLKETLQPTLDRVSLRMEYVQPYLIDGDEYTRTQLRDAMTASQGMTHIDQIIHRSALYADMHMSNGDIASVEDYLTHRTEELQHDNHDLFNRLEVLAGTDPEQFAYLYQHVDHRIAVLGGDEQTPQELKDTASYMQRFGQLYAYKNRQRQREYITAIDGTTDYVAIEASLQHLTDGELLVPRGIAENLILESVYYDTDVSRDKLSSTLSESLGQNILYEIAKQLHGYKGENTMLGLIGFFDKSHADTYGIYYDDGRYLNDDRARDKQIDIQQREERDADQIISYLHRKIIHSNIDTKTERVDDRLNTEYMGSIESIVATQASYRTSEYRKQLTEDVAHYVTQVADYTLLPEYMVRSLSRAGFGDYSQVYLRMSDDHIQVISTYHHHLPDRPDYTIQQSYAPVLMDTLPGSHQTIIDDINARMKPLLELRRLDGEALVGSGNDELDMPIEMQRELTRLSHERQLIQERIRTMQPKIGINLLIKAQRTYAKQFHNVYITLLHQHANFYLSNDQQTDELRKALATDRYQLPVLNTDIATTTTTYLRDGHVLELNSEIIENDHIREMFAQLSEKKLLDDKSLVDLVAIYAKNINTDQIVDTDCISYYCALLMQAIYETQSIQFENGSIYDLHDATENLTVDTVYDRLKVLMHQQPYIAINQFSAPKDIDTDDIYMAEVISPDQRSIDQTVAELSAYIYGTDIQRDLGSERGIMHYDHVTGELESRGHSFALSDVTATAAHIDGFDSNIPLSEALRYANLINKLHADYSRGSIEDVHISTLGNLEIDIANKTWDIVLMRSRSLKKYFPTLSHDVDAFAQIVNQHVAS